GDPAEVHHPDHHPAGEGTGRAPGGGGPDRPPPRGRRPLVRGRPDQPARHPAHVLLAPAAAGEGVRLHRARGLDRGRPEGQPGPDPAPGPEAEVRGGRKARAVSTTTARVRGAPAGAPRTCGRGARQGRAERRPPSRGRAASEPCPVTAIRPVRPTPARRPPLL